MALGAFSQSGPWRPAAGARLARTLGLRIEMQSHIVPTNSSPVRPWVIAALSFVLIGAAPAVERMSTGIPAVDLQLVREHVYSLEATLQLCADAAPSLAGRLEASRSRWTAKHQRLILEIERFEQSLQNPLRDGFDQRMNRARRLNEVSRTSVREVLAQEFVARRPAEVRAICENMEYVLERGPGDLEVFLADYLRALRTVLPSPR